MVVALYLLSFTILILVLFTEVTTGEISENSPSFNFKPEITLPLTGLYGLIIGGMFAFISLRSRIRLREPMKRLIPLYPFYVGFPLVAGGCLMIIGLIIIFDPFQVPMWPCLRLLMSSLVYIGFLWFPTLESMFEIFFQSRVSKLEAIMERDKVLDIIDHDLANVTQILHTYFETQQLSDHDRFFLKKQVDRMSKLITESRAIVTHEDDALVKELIDY